MNAPAASSRPAGWTGWPAWPGAAAVAVLLWRMFCTVERVQWNAPRLTPSFALLRGLDFYGTRTEGPYLGWVYGPVFPLCLAPAAWAPGLDAAFAVAWGINLAAFLAPAWLVARLALADRRGAALALFFWCALCLGAEVTGTQFYYLHVDTLCLGWTLLAACAVLRAIRTTESNRWLAAAALATSLAVWTKQSAAAVPVIIAAWLFVRGHRRPAARYLAATVALGGLLGAGFMAWFGSERLLFNLVWLHLNNPVRPDGQLAFFGQLLASSPGWLAAVLALLVGRSSGDDPAAPARQARSLLLWLACGSLPLGLLAAVKVAGGWNSVHALNYALLALALALAGRVSRPEARGPARWAIAGAAMVLLAAGWWAAERADLCWRPDRTQSEALATARQHPGRVYLPWNPLVTLITDGRIYPFDDALVCLSRQGIPAPISAVRRDIPEHALVIYPEPAQSRYALEYLAGARTTELPENH